MKTYYPIGSIRSQIHAIELNANRTLCSVRPPWHWSMAYAGDVYPEIGEFVKKHDLTQSEGFYVGGNRAYQFAAEYQFCVKCFNKLKQIKGVR